MDYHFQKSNISENIRKCAIILMVYITGECGMMERTLYLATVIFDKYVLLANPLQQDLVKILMVCIRLASKIEEKELFDTKDSMIELGNRFNKVAVTNDTGYVVTNNTGDVVIDDIKFVVMNDPKVVVTDDPKVVVTDDPKTKSNSSKSITNISRPSIISPLITMIDLVSGKCGTISSGDNSGTDSGNNSDTDSGVDSGTDSGNNSDTDSGVDFGTDDNICEAHKLISHVFEIIGVAGSLDLDNSYYKSIKYNIHYNELETDILEKIYYGVYDNTIILAIDMICNQYNICEDDRDFMCLMGALTLTTIDYMFVDPIVMAHKIFDFSMLIELDEVDFSDDPILSYLFFHLQSTYIDNHMYQFANMYETVKYCKTIKHKMIGLDWSIINLKITLSRQDTNYQYNVVKNNMYGPEIMAVPGIEKLGRGSFGNVYKANVDNKLIALKRIIPDIDMGIDQYFLREINTMAKLNHSNIVKLFGFYYEHSAKIMIIGMELMDCTILEYIRRNYIVHDHIKNRFILQLLSAIEYMHKLNIIHRDITSINVLVSFSGNLKICDFGSSRFRRCGNYERDFSPVVCSIGYRAIEILLNKFPYTDKIDVWACGCLIYFILAQQNLIQSKFENNKNAENENRILTELTTRFRDPNCINTDTVDNCESTETEYDSSDDTDTDYNCQLIDINKSYPQHVKILLKMFNFMPNDRISISVANNLFIKIIGNCVSNRSDRVSDSIGGGIGCGNTESISVQNDVKSVSVQDNSVSDNNQ